MNRCHSPINMNRRYIQFNDLVIDQYDMLGGASNTRTFKQTTAPYYAKHGSHYFVQNTEVLTSEQSLSVSIHLDLRKLRGNDRDLYKKYVLMNLAQNGRIFAIEGKNLIWTFAIVASHSEVYSSNADHVTIDVDFILPWGYWIEADSRSIFFAPFDLCDWNASFNLENNQFCVDCTCACKDEKEPCAWCISQCEFLTIENSLCVRAREVLQTFITDCDTRYRIIQNCEARRRLWHRERDLYEFSYCRMPSDSRMLATKFKGNTVLTSHLVTLILDGEFNDPVIQLNSVKFQIKGHFIGRIIIRNNLTATFISSEDCGCEEGGIPFEDIILEAGFELYVKNGNNKIVIDTGVCNQVNCVRVNYRPITT